MVEQNSLMTSALDCRGECARLLRTDVQADAIHLHANGE